MAFNPIETDYRPNFGLGAYYQGINAANAKQLTEEDILKAFLANQKEQNEQPLDLMVKQWQATHAQDQMNSPEYRQAMLDGYIGQMKSQIAAGRKASETVSDEISAINQENKNKFEVAKLLEQFRNKQLGQDQPTSSYEQPTPLQGDNGKMGFNFGSASNALQNPDLTSQQRQLIMQDAAKRGENVLSTFKQSGLENALVNTPEQIQAINKIKAMGENQQNVAGIRGQYSLEAARLRASQIVKNPKDTEVVAHALLVASKSIPANAEEQQAARDLLEIKTNMGAIMRSAGVQPSLNLPETKEKGSPQNNETPYTKYDKNPNSLYPQGLLTGDNTRRNQIPRQGTGTKEDPIKLN